MHPQKSLGNSSKYTCRMLLPLCHTVVEPQFLSLSFSFSVTHTHTRVRTHTNTHTLLYREHTSTHSSTLTYTEVLSRVPPNPSQAHTEHQPTNKNTKDSSIGHQQFITATNKRTEGRGNTTNGQGCVVQHEAVDPLEVGHKTKHHTTQGVSNADSWQEPGSTLFTDTCTTDDTHWWWLWWCSDDGQGSHIWHDAIDPIVVHPVAKQHTIQHVSMSVADRKHAARSSLTPAQPM